MNTRKTTSVPAHLKAFTGNPNYRKNQEAARHNSVRDNYVVGRYASETECCALCGKKALGSQHVLLTNVGEYTTIEEMDENDKAVEARGGCPDDLGYYPVGSDCAKKLKAAGVMIYDCFGYGRGEKELIDFEVTET